MNKSKIFKDREEANKAVKDLRLAYRRALKVQAGIRKQIRIIQAKKT